MIAKRVPQRNELTKSVKSNAALYGITEQEYRNACRDWLENEGYDELGNEYEDVYAWLTTDHNQRHKDPETGLMAAGGLNIPLQ